MLRKAKLSKFYRTQDEKWESFGQQSYVERTKWFIRLVTLKGRVAVLEDPQFESLFLPPDCGDFLLGEALLLGLSGAVFSCKRKCRFLRTAKEIDAIVPG